MVVRRTTCAINVIFITLTRDCLMGILGWGLSIVPVHPQPAPAGPDTVPSLSPPTQQAPPERPSTTLPTITVEARRRPVRTAKPGPSAPASTTATATATPAVPAASSAPAAGTEGTAANGYRATSAANAGPFANISLQKTPYSISVTPGALFENNNVHTVSDALKTNPTVVPLIESNGPASGLSRVMIRGFTAADQSELRDGMTDRSFTYPPLENVDHIEVLNGPSGFLYGFSQSGGTVNYVSKQPTPQPFANLTAGIYGGAIGFVHADASGSAGPDNRVGYRINFYQEDGDTYIDEGKQKRTLFSGVLSYRIGDSSILSFDYYHQDYDVTGIRVDFAPFSSGGIAHVPTPLNAAKQYGQPWTGNSSQKDLVGTKFVSDLNDTFTLRTAVRYGNMWRDTTIIDGIFTNASGSSYTENATRTTRQFENSVAGYSLVDAKLDTLSIHHLVTFGYTDAYFYFTRGPNVTTTLGTSSTAAPTQFAEPATFIPGTSNFQAQNLGNALIGDRITLNDYWSAIVGVNDAMVNQTAGGVNGPPSTALGVANFQQSKVTPTYSLLFTPRPWVTLYGTYIETLSLGDQAPATFNGLPVVNAGEVLAPSVSTEYEAGAKFNFGRFDLTTAFFNINKVNAETNPENQVFIQDGREVHQGVEVTSKGKVTDQLTFVGGFTLMDAKIQQATALPASNGKIPINVPEQQARAYFEYALPPSFVPDATLVAGANYYGKRPVDALNTSFMAPATIFDAGLRYEPVVYGRKLTFNLTVSNLFNTSYWASFNTGMLLGAPRIIALSGKIPLW
jgi:iron complex outermembrane recepter protein